MPSGFSLNVHVYKILVSEKKGQMNELNCKQHAWLSYRCILTEGPFRDANLCY